MYVNPTNLVIPLSPRPVFDREQQLERIFQKPIWDANDLALILDVKIGTVMHMRSRNQLPGLIQINLRKWVVNRDEFMKGKGMAKRGRPPGSKSQP